MKMNKMKKQMIRKWNRFLILYIKKEKSNPIKTVIAVVNLKKRNYKMNTKL